MTYLVISVNIVLLQTWLFQSSSSLPLLFWGSISIFRPSKLLHTDTLSLLRSVLGELIQFIPGFTHLNLLICYHSSPSFFHLFPPSHSPGMGLTTNPHYYCGAHYRSINNPANNLHLLSSNLFTPAAHVNPASQFSPSFASGLSWGKYTCIQIHFCLFSIQFSPTLWHAVVINHVLSPTLCHGVVISHILFPNFWHEVVINHVSPQCRLAVMHLQHSAMKRCTWKIMP